MPTSKRRRKFSVKNDITKRKSSKNQNNQTGLVESKTNAPINNLNNVCELNAQNSKNIANISSTLTCDSTTSISAKSSPERQDKEITVSTTMLKLNTLLYANDSLIEQFQKLHSPHQGEEKGNEIKLNRERTPIRRDRHPREHRIKVRSPKRRMLIVEKGIPVDFIDNNKRTVGIPAINWKEEFSFKDIETTNDEESSHSIDDICRICHGGESLTLELGRLISACACRGTVGRVHVKCLERWLTESGKSRCELCGTQYSTRRVHRYGVAKAFVMWVLSQNAKQLIVDSLGIMLMSPLAVLAAWLSGRTLAGLMTQESHVTPWPLASTFVLACMTLVCYYCWIVSAATRHALGWWIWYRSQYEVRLDVQDGEE